MALEELPERLIQLEESAFVEFGQRYRRPFFAYLRRHGYSEADAVDLTGTALTDIPVKVGKFELGTDFNAWVWTCFRNLVRSEWRSKGRKEVPDGESKAQLLRLPTGYEQRVRAAIATLEPVDQAILAVLYDGAERPATRDAVSAISERAGITLSEANVRQRHKRALTKLKRILSDLIPAEESND